MCGVSEAPAPGAGPRYVRAGAAPSAAPPPPPAARPARPATGQRARGTALATATARTLLGSISVLEHSTTWLSPYCSGLEVHLWAFGPVRV